MNKRYQVFLSSIYVDLVEERLEVIKALLELDCIPCGMEYFPAANEETWTYIANLIDQCDYYVVIVGGRYGSVTSDGVSFTQKEYSYAQSKGIPCIAFIHGKPDELPVKKTEPTEDGKRRLWDFVATLKKSLCKEWHTPHELGAVVSRSVTQLMKRHPRTGWIPANQAGDPNTTQEILNLTKKVSELEEDLRKARGRSAIDVSELADGDDAVDLSVSYAVSVKVNRNGWTSSEIVSRHDSIVTVTWNDLFRAIAPRIAPFASDTAIRNGVNGLLLDRFDSSNAVVDKDQRVSGVTISEESFNTVKVQFSALGLVTVSKEKNDYGGMTGVLWRLTEAGSSRMIQSLAIKKPTTVPRPTSS